MKTTITFKYIVIAFAAVAATWLVHEFAHWFMGELLGYEMSFTLNSAAPAEAYTKNWHANLVSAAGPMVTCIQATIFFLLLVRRPVIGLFPFLFVPFYMRLMAAGMNIINLNDEGRISSDLGIGTYTLPVLVSIFLFLLVYMVTKKWELKRQFIFWTLLFTMVASSILILADQAFSIRIL